MKICDLTQFYSPYSGGVKRYLTEKIRFLREEPEFIEHVLIVPGERTALETPPRGKIYTIKSPLVSRTSRYRILWRLDLVGEILERERPDIIESGDPYQMAWKVAASARAMGVASVGFYHSHFPEAYLRSTMRFLGECATDVAMDLARRYVRRLYNRFDRTLVPSRQLANLLEEWGVDNVQATDLGVDTSTFHPDPARRAARREQLGLATDERLLLYVGRLAQEKNTRTLLEAFEMLDARGDATCRLLIVGDGGQRDLVLALTEKCDRVRWIRYVGDAGELADLYRAADLFVHPGVQETFGLVALESQACGTPVVGIRGSYMDRLICDLRHWAEANTPESLASAMADMCALDLAGLGRAAADAVSVRYSWRQVFSRLLSIYTEVVSDKRTAVIY